jgi:hypothetical protein
MNNPGPINPGVDQAHRIAFRAAKVGAGIIPVPITPIAQPQPAVVVAALVGAPRMLSDQNRPPNSRENTKNDALIEENTGERRSTAFRCKSLRLLWISNGGERGRTYYWRKGWDSNPRYPCRHAGFQDRCLKPLGHPSVAAPSST